MIEILFLASVWGVCGLLFANVLVQEGEIFGFWKKFVNYIVVEEEILTKSIDEYKPVQQVILKLFFCSKCLAGQIALWCTPMVQTEYHPFAHFATVIFSIFIGYILSEKL